MDSMSNVKKHSRGIGILRNYRLGPWAILVTNLNPSFSKRYLFPKNNSNFHSPLYSKYICTALHICCLFSLWECQEILKHQLATDSTIDSTTPSSFRHGFHSQRAWCGLYRSCTCTESEWITRQRCDVFSPAKSLKYNCIESSSKSHHFLRTILSARVPVCAAIKSFRSPTVSSPLKWRYTQC